MSGIELIVKEREEQIVKHGRNVENDAKNNNEFQLTEAAATLTINIPEGLFDEYISYHEKYPPTGWSGDSWGKMLKKPYKDRLVIAGALLAAEYDRVDSTEAADAIISILKT